MLSYCLKCRNNIRRKYPKVAKTKNRILMLLSKCSMYDSKKKTLIKQPEASGLLGSLGIKTPLRKIPLVGPILFLRIIKKLI